MFQNSREFPKRTTSRSGVPEKIHKTSTRKSLTPDGIR